VAEACFAAQARQIAIVSEVTASVDMICAEMQSTAM